MKTKHKLTISFLVSIGIIIFLGVFLVGFLKNNYISLKYKKANDYYLNNDITIDEYAQYLIDKGFIVTRQEVKAYSSELYEVCHKEDDQIVVYEDGAPALYGIINEKIINDFLNMLTVILIFVIVFIILVLLLIYIYIYKEIVNKIEVLESNMKNYNELDKYKIEKMINNFNKNKLNNELYSLEYEFYTMLKKILKDQEQKEQLIIMLSHELKTPLTKIEAVMDMYIQNFEGYGDKEKVSNLVVQESHKMNKTINDLLTFYKTNYSYIKEEVNVSQLIDEVFKDEMFENKRLKVEVKNKNKFNVQLEEEKLRILLNNIKSNIYKYSLDNSVVNIIIGENVVMFENKINEKKEKNSTKVGNIINKHLASEINVNIKNEIKKEKYITILSF